MTEKKKEELRQIANEFQFLQQLIKVRMDCGIRSTDERNRDSEQIAGQIIAAQQTYTVIET